MTVKVNQLELLYWNIALATLVLLACFSHIDSTTMDPKTIVVGSSASQHALGVDHSDAQVKRFLRSDSSMTKKIDGSNEERIFSLGLFPEAAFAGVEKAFNYLRTIVAPNNQKTTDQRFVEFGVNTIKIDEHTGDLFKNDKFRKWAKSVDDAYKTDDVAAHVAAEVAKISTLLSEYGKDRVFNMLAAGKNVPDTKITAENLEIGLLIKWTADDERVDDVFKLLQLSKDQSNVLKNPLLRVWIKYASEMDKTPHEVLFAKLKQRYNDKELAELLAVAKGDDFTTKTAKQLEELQLKEWKDSRKSERDIYELLELHQVGSFALLSSPSLNTWVSYANMLEKKPYDFLFSETRFMKDLEIAEILAKATDNPIDAKTVQELKNRQLEKWSSDKKSGNDVFQLLELKSIGKKMIGSPLWDMWISYMTKLENEKQDPQTRKLIAHQISLVLKKEIGDKALLQFVTGRIGRKAKKVAAMLEHSVWTITKHTLAKVFDLLKLKEKGNNAFESPEFKSWVNYVTQMKEPPKDLALISLLKKTYGSDLHKMLETSSMSEDAVTKEFCTRLLELLKQKKTKKKFWLFS